MMFLAGAILVLLAVGLFVYINFAGPKLPPETDAIIESVFSRDLPEIVTGNTGFASSDGLNIWYESISPEGTPKGAPKGTVLLLTSVAGDGLMWPPKFVRAFLDAGYQVIRYDHRSTGMSDWVKGWSDKHTYSLTDMANDAAAVLDALAVQKAHLIGLSMGGMIAQELAIAHPDRVASLTLMMTTGFVGDPDLPMITSRHFFSLLITGLPLLKYRLMGGEKNLIKERVAKMLLILPKDEIDIQELAELVLYDLRKRRGINLRALFQHQTAINRTPSRYEKLKTLQMPTLVIHGTADQLLPIEHGKKLVEIIPNAKGLWLEGVRHIFPLQQIDTWMKAVLAHLDMSS